MTARKLTFAFAFAALAASGCGGTPATTDAGTDARVVEGDSGPPECAPGTEMCGADCVDTDSSRDHCGACGNACSAGEACVSGSCSIVCPSGQAQCDGVCSDTQSDRLHCGDCDTTCGAGEICVGGFCEISCPATQTECGGACVDTQSDPANCGACGTACDAGEVCSTGTCATACGAGLAECGGACVSTQNDPAHCGGCDMACPAPAGGAGLCAAGACRGVCDALTGDCNADIGSATGDGCETPLATDAENCGACGRVCSLANAVSGCAAGGCVVATCDAGFDDCDGMDATGCEADLGTDVAHCGACGNACAAGEVCFAGTCITPVGEDCSDAFALMPGANTITWTASVNDYLTTNPSCLISSYAPVGPDVVLSYTATTDERVSLTFDKPASARWVAVASTAACGTPTPEASCISDFSPTTMSGQFVLTAGQTAYVYVSDTDSGDATLTNPLVVNVAATSCTAAPPVTLDPPSGSTLATLSSSFSVTFGAPVLATSGTVTITGDMGTSRTYDLASVPAEITWSAGNTVMTVNASGTYRSGETITIGWSGIQAVVCTSPVLVPAPAGLQLVAPTTPCSPGAGGVIGSGTLTRIPTGLTSLSESYVVADQSPTGYVYFGGTGELYRMPKAGGTVEDVEMAAGLTTIHLGYTMVIDGLDIFTVDSTTTSGATHVYRISTDGGATWSVQPYASFPTNPGDDFRGATVYGGRIYLVTDESTDTAATEIWSLDADATTLPTAATLERTFEGNDCSGIVRDASFYYVICGTDDRLVRVPVAGGGAAELITDTIDFNITVNSLHGEDIDADGTLDVLYVHGGREQAHFVCSPASATPYVDRHSFFGTGSANYGMGVDLTSLTLWMIDDDTRELVSVR